MYSKYHYSFYISDYFCIYLYIYNIYVCVHYLSSYIHSDSQCISSFWRVNFQGILVSKELHEDASQILSNLCIASLRISLQHLFLVFWVVILVLIRSFLRHLADEESLGVGEYWRYQLKMAIYSGITHWKWWFSIVMLVYQKVDIWVPTKHSTSGNIRDTTNRFPKGVVWRRFSRMVHVWGVCFAISISWKFQQHLSTTINHYQPKDPKVVDPILRPQSLQNRLLIYNLTLPMNG